MIIVVVAPIALANTYLEMAAAPCTCVKLKVNVIFLIALGQCQKYATFCPCARQGIKGCMVKGPQASFFFCHVRLRTGLYSQFNTIRLTLTFTDSLIPLVTTLFLSLCHLQWM